MDLGTRIVAWRRKRGLRQQALADAADVGVSAVSMWEKNHAAPKQKHLVAIVDLFGITMERFYGPVPKLKKRAVA